MATARANGRLQPGHRWSGSASPASPPAPSATCDEHSWDFGANYRLFLLGSPRHPMALKVGGAFRDTRSRRRHPGLRHRTAALGDAADGSRRRRQSSRPRTSTRAASSSTPTPTAGGTPPPTGSPPAYGQVEWPVTAAAAAHRRRARRGLAPRRRHADTSGQHRSCVPPPQHRHPAVARAELPPDARTRTCGFSATQTLSRPEYRELSPVAYFEQVGLRDDLRQPGPAAGADPELRRPLGVVPPRRARC